jgi:BON domain-containing protein
MTDTDRLSPEEVAALEGTPPLADQDAFVEPHEIEHPDEPTDTERYEGDGVVAPQPLSAGIFDELTRLDDRPGETDDPNVAAEEGETWVPPIDPPVVADATSPDGMTVAAGFGSTALDEPFDADHHSSLLPVEDEVTARVREALLADARTSRLAGRVAVETDGGTVTVAGVVDDLEDGDLLAEVASAVTGVTEVVDRTEVEGL